MMEKTNKEIVEEAIKTMNPYIYNAYKRIWNKGFLDGANWREQNPVNALPENDGWISVKDKLPVKEGRYLVYDINSFGLNKIDTLRFEITTKRWFELSDEYHPQFWQPLPSPPKV